MTEQTYRSPMERTDPLVFQGHPIAYIMLDGVPYFSLSDLCAAMGWTDQAAVVVNRPDFPDHAKEIVEEQTADGWQPSLVLSPVGVFLWGHSQDPGRTQGLVAWTRREAARLCPNPRPDDPAMVLTLMSNGDLPPRPYKFSGYLSAWRDLKDTGAHHIARAEFRERQLAPAREALRLAIGAAR